MFDIFLYTIEIIGTIAFAISGAMIAIENKLDIFGVVVLGATTAVGGGLLRDIMIGRVPQNLFLNPTCLIIALITSLIVFIIFYFLKNLSITSKKWYQDIITISDALGLGIFVIMGANETINMGYTGFFIVCFMSSITAFGGGLIRDLMARKIPVIFRKHIYAIASILDSILYYSLYHTALNKIAVMMITILFIVILRFLAYKLKLSLPVVKIEPKEEEHNND